MSGRARGHVRLHASLPLQHAAGPSPLEGQRVHHEEKVQANGARSMTAAAAVMPCVVMLVLDDCFLLPELLALFW